MNIIFCRDNILLISHDLSIYIVSKNLKKLKFAKGGTCSWRMEQSGKLKEVSENMDANGGLTKVFRSSVSPFQQKYQYEYHYSISIREYGCNRYQYQYQYGVY